MATAVLELTPSADLVTTGPILRRSYPATRDFGLIEASVDDAATAFSEWLGRPQFTRRLVGPTLEGALGALSPFSVQMRRTLFLSTRSSWTGFFRSGISGSDPFFPMCGIAGRLHTRTMRICAIDRPPWPTCIWEVYEHSSAADAIHGARVRRAIQAANDGGRWTFNHRGKPFEFEERSRYAMPRKRDRFDQELLSRYLERFGLRPFDDDFYDVSAHDKAILLEENDLWPNASQYTLDELEEGVPWRRR